MCRLERNQEGASVTDPEQLRSEEPGLYRFTGSQHTPFPGSRAVGEEASDGRMITSSISTKLPLPPAFRQQPWVTFTLQTALSEGRGCFPEAGYVIFLPPLPVGFSFWCHLPCPDDEKVRYLLWREGGRGVGVGSSVDRSLPSGQCHLSHAASYGCISVCPCPSHHVVGSWR